MGITIAGCDCGKNSLHVCLLRSDERPSNVKQFARKYKPLIVKTNREDVDKLIALNADLYVLEPTGSYSYVWINALKRAGKLVKLVSPRKIRHYAEYQGLTNKADKPDAAAICLYSLENFDNEQAFLKTERLEIRRLYLRLNSLAGDKNPVQNRLGQILAYEFPEMVSAYESADRKWLVEQPPAIWRYIAGEDMTACRIDKQVATRWNTAAKSSIGTGLSSDSQELAAQLCSFERMEYRLEKKVDEELATPEYAPYHEVFDRFEIPPRIRAALLSRIYPFDDFLRNGKPFKEYVNGDLSRRASGMTKRDRSEGEFKRSLGMGKELKQSGDKTTWKACGSSYARTAIWQFIKVKIVIGRSQGGNFADKIQPLVKSLDAPGVSPWLNSELIEAVANFTETTPEVASLRLHFEFQADQKKGDLRTSATAGRFCRMLYKALLKKIYTPTRNAAIPSA